MRLDFYYLSLSGNGLLGGHFNWTDKAYSVPMAQYKSLFQLTRACWSSSFALSSSLSVRPPLVDPLQSQNLRPPMDQVRTSCFRFAHLLPVYLTCALLSLAR